MIAGAPLALLREWLPGNEDEDRPQVQVATVDAEARPDLRTVLLSGWDDRGFVFHTDAASRKVAQLGTSRAVAMLVLWPGSTRQLVVRGVAEDLDAQELEPAYLRRSPYLQQLAWLNSEALAQQDPAGRRATWGRFAAEHAGTPLRPPPTWTGYRVEPDRLTFWSSDPDGPSHRTEYRLGVDAWQEHHLAG